MIRPETHQRRHLLFDDMREKAWHCRLPEQKERFLQDLDVAVVYDIEPVVDFAFGLPGDGVKFLALSQPLLPGFRVIWMDWSISTSVRIPGGALVRRHSWADFNKASDECKEWVECEWVLELWMFIGINGQVGGPWYRNLVGLRADGLLARTWTSQVGQPFKDGTDAFDVGFMPCYWALGFSHLKNKVERKVTAPAALNASRARKGKPPLVSYTTICLPSQRYSESAMSHTAPSGERRLHTVAAHFKTYTEESRLMGKFTGTYLWLEHERGRYDRGVVISDYKVGPPQ